MTAVKRITPPAALACAMVLLGGPLVLKGMYDWMGQRSDVAAQPFQRDRVMIYLAALLVAGGAAAFALIGERGPAMAVLATAVVPVLVILPGSYTQYTAIYPCLITVAVGAAMALRTMLLPGAAVALVSVLIFVVIAVAGGYLLRGLLDATLFIAEGVRAHAATSCAAWRGWPWYRHRSCGCSRGTGGWPLSPPRSSWWLRSPSWTGMTFWAHCSMSSPGLWR